jgi:hypothetical protein
MWSSDVAVETTPIPLPPGWRIDWRGDGLFDLTTDEGNTRWTPLSGEMIEDLIRAYWKENSRDTISINGDARICQIGMTKCKCYDKMGNDYWLLPTGACLYKQESEKPRTPDGTRDLDVEF